MKVKALRVAAYLLIAHFLIVAALSFLGRSGPDYMQLAVALALVAGATGALFNPRKRGWLAVLAYVLVICGRQVAGIWVTFGNPAVPLGMKITAIVILLVVDSLAIAALVLVFLPANFAAFAATAPGPGATT
jgi:hypothetical protein